MNADELMRESNELVPESNELVRESRLAPVRAGMLSREPNGLGIPCRGERDRNLVPARGQHLINQ